MRKRVPLVFIIGIPLLCLLCVLVYNLPPVNEQLAWRIDNLRTQIKYTLNPPEEVIFVPQGQLTSPPEISPSPSPTQTPTVTPTPPGSTATLSPSPTPTLTPTPLPSEVYLTGVRYEDQHGLWNYCGPANLSMALSYWGWEGNRLDTGQYLKPYDKDKNIMPYEMVDFVEEMTDLKAVTRMGGDLELIKKFIANGYPVLVEKGTYLVDYTGVRSWMGHFEVMTGYNESKGLFIAQDSYTTPDFEIPYDVFQSDWRSFNYAYLMIYPPEKEEEVMAILGSHADETYSFRYAAQVASEEIYSLSGIDQLFAWFNRGTSLMKLQDFAGAAAAYDEYYALYPQIDIPNKERPWRILWYQTGPYFAYFYTIRYQDVIYLATTTLTYQIDLPILEESYYWRAMAKAALGDTTGAIEDYRTSLEYHTGFAPSLYQLQLLGVEP